MANATHAAAESLQRWCTTLGAPSVLVSDTASHFKNQLRKLAHGSGVNHKFAVANSPWTNGTVESMMKEVLHNDFKSIACGISMCHWRLGEICTHGAMDIKLITSTAVGLFPIQIVFWNRAHFNAGILNP